MRNYQPPAQKSASLAVIITIVSLAAFAIFGGVYALSLNGGTMVTAPTDSLKFEQPAWIPPEERGRGNGQAAAPQAGTAPQKPAVEQGQF
jgi:hypothetical protein